MCGIAGAWGKADVTAMTKALAHRGPDDEGIYVDAARSVTLGNRRLAVVDLQGGRQPIGNENGTIWVTFNGEIFNYRELRATLEAMGHRFRTNTDTEVIVHAYEQYGVDCVRHFNGMFAFAVWDGTRLFLARDRMGEKPLYYALDGGRFLFASEIKALLTEIAPVPHIHQDYFVFEDNLSEHTLFKGIKELKAAHRLVYDGERVSVERYWAPESFDGTVRPDDYYEERLAELLYDAVTIRLAGEVSWGSFLSGGLDSSIIACIARPPIVFTARYDEGPQFDESFYAKSVAKFIGAEQVFVSSSPGQVKTRLPEIIRFLDQPISTSSTITSFELAKAAADRRVKVILNGQGSDECFGGYTRYVFMHVENSMLQSKWLAPYEPMARRFWGGSAFSDPAGRYLRFIQRVEPSTLDPLRLVRDCFSLHGPVVNQMGYTDCLLSLQHLITMDDRACAHVGIESRSPFLDHRLVEFAFQLPPHLKIKEYETKYLLRKVAARFCPQEVVRRVSKMGMVSPIGIWLQRELAGWASELGGGLRSRSLDLPVSGPEEYGAFDRRLHAIVSLELWFRTFIDPVSGHWTARPPSGRAETITVGAA
jgi:asparagine synthase (glutamine-hydrolysing)